VRLLLVLSIARLALWLRTLAADDSTETLLRSDSPFELINRSSPSGEFSRCNSFIGKHGVRS
jgi:hypothetical protein